LTLNTPATESDLLSDTEPAALVRVTFVGAANG
jgi:hypothetical protein